MDLLLPALRQLRGVHILASSTNKNIKIAVTLVNTVAAEEDMERLQDLLRERYD